MRLKKENNIVFYLITGTETLDTGKGRISRQIPSFFLNSNIQGIVSEEHAVKIAKNILDPWNNADIELSLWATEVKD